MCFKAAMAISTGVSCLLGRIGLIEVWIITIIGLFGF
jgi:hypothetical protein